MRTRWTLISPLILVLGFAPAPFPRTARLDPKADDVRKLQGEWVLTEQSHGGRNLKEANDTTHLSVVGERWSFSYQGQVASQWDVRLNPAVTPRALDMKEVKRTATLYAIYRFENGLLTVCYDEKGRPTGFDSKESHWVMTFKRR